VAAVRVRITPSNQGLPPVVEAEVGCENLRWLIDAAADQRELLDAKLLEHGALLLRGFGARTLGDFQQVVAAFSRSDSLFNYAGGASPRKALGEANGVYSSTEYPADMTLSLHNELSYTDAYPSRLFFFCLVEPTSGGQTTLGDSRRILRSIDPEVVELFRTNGVRYVRNLWPHKGSGYSWQEALETDDRAIAEERCRAIGADFSWRADGVLRVSQARPATAIHPATGEEVWFNQADGFHPSALAPDTYAELLDLCGTEEEFRLNSSYGDSSPIPLAALENIRAALRDETVPHRWRAGDILVLDNLLAAHGRMPFSGLRKIALAMS